MASGSSSAVGGVKAEDAAIFDELRQQVLQVRSVYDNWLSNCRAKLANNQIVLEAAITEYKENEERAKAAAVQMQIRAEQQTLQLKQQQRDLRKKEAAKAVELFRERLGLSLIKNRDGTLLFSFTRIDQENHDRRFCCSLRVNNDNIFEVVRCDPPLAEVGALLAELQTSNNLSAFIKSIRKAFQNSVKR